MKKSQLVLAFAFLLMGSSGALAAEGSVSIHNASPKKIYGIALAPSGTATWTDVEGIFLAEGGEGDIIDVGADSRPITSPTTDHYDIKVSASKMGDPKLSECIIKDVDFAKPHVINFVGKKCVPKK